MKNLLIDSLLAIFSLPIHAYANTDDTPPLIGRYPGSTITKKVERTIPMLHLLKR